MLTEVAITVFSSGIGPLIMLVPVLFVVVFFCAHLATMCCWFQTALSHLCVHGNGRCVEEFSRLPFVDANLADKDGNTPLHHAAQAG